MKCPVCGEDMDGEDFYKVLYRFGKWFEVAVTRPAAIYSCDGCGAVWEWVKKNGLSLVQRPTHRDLVSATEMLELGIDSEDIDNEAKWMGK